jgi:hypothetical protein
VERVWRREKVSGRKRRKIRSGGGVESGRDEGGRRWVEEREREWRGRRGVCVVSAEEENECGCGESVARGEGGVEKECMRAGEGVRGKWSVEKVECAWRVCGKKESERKWRRSSPRV